MKKLTILFLFFLSMPLVFSQTEKKPEPTFTRIIDAPVEDPLIKEFSLNLQRARQSEDIYAKQFWENKLNELTKPQVITGTDKNIIYEKVTQPQNNPTSLNLTTLVGNNLIVSANVISRERIKGDIYAATVITGFGMASDTLKVFRSTNNGISFSPVGKLFSAGIFLVTNNSIDIEAVSKGDSTFAFVGISYRGDNLYSSSLVLRVRQDGIQSVGYVAGNSTLKYTNIRLTSDNAAYTSSTYIYISLTLDSTAAGVRRLKSKLFRIESTFAYNIKLLSGYQNPVFGQYGYAVTGSAPDTAKFESDIAYVNDVNNNDLLFTISIIRGVPGVFDDGKSMYFTRSDSYGRTQPTLFTVSDGTRYKESPRIAATGKANNSAVVITRRLFGGTDWDAYSFWTTDITVPAPAFPGSFVDPPPATDITMDVSVAANYRSNGSYMFAFSNRYAAGKTNVYTRPFYNLNMGTLVKSNPDNIYGADTYAAPDAGFRGVNNDSCLVIWGGQSGAGSYVTGGCSGPFIGVNNNNSTIEGYYLAQNYPNPFNPSTSIAFEIKDKGFVTLKVYDVLGNEVMQLMNEKKEAGSHVVQFDAGNLPSGTYFYKITTDKFSDVKKMVLVK